MPSFQLLFEKLQGTASSDETLGEQTKRPGSEYDTPKARPGTFVF